MDRAELPTGTVTFLFTDIEGSTRLLQERSKTDSRPALVRLAKDINQSSASRMAALFALIGMNDATPEKTQVQLLARAIGRSDTGRADSTRLSVVLGPSADGR